MNRYQKLFTNLHQQKLGAFVPFITVGDPDPDSFINIIDTLIEAGADALELGIPFSDPLSDGPAIQKSMERAFKSGINFFLCLKLINDIRSKYPHLPIGLLIYANLIMKHGIKNFYCNCSKLNIDSVLIPDLPIEESSLFYKTAMYYKIAHIFICPPNANFNLIKQITNQGQGYIYLLSRPGITGINNDEFNITVLNMLIQHIKQQKRVLPILQGFGIHTPDQAHQSLLSGTSGVIIGSAIANIIEDNLSSNPIILLTQLKKLTHLIKISMKL
ncbi:tryptophan synthase, alpha subunit [Candidatus Blochmanniella vafra str. BVAF]|uniref:Tryptophan synthase alpha chain n=1 Tax=Blochmanniella vafra (strain BVAF) TaxID=859654 RepID=E8Q6C7_BLOVB|nr:tryptophan synthase subunit alpha [Candidatus Blochmannia vafer]ADV33821.1 tryptophan synthase, alpha subunit [Candidatus Blochmannia vafer str. BVAF]